MRPVSLPIRCFARKARSTDVELRDGFNFGKHKEYVSEEYYRGIGTHAEEEESDDLFGDG